MKKNQRKRAIRVSPTDFEKLGHRALPMNGAIVPREFVKPILALLKKLPRQTPERMGEP